MNLGSLYNKSKELISKGYNDVKDKIVEYKNSSDAFNALKNSCDIIECVDNTNVNNQYPTSYRARIIKDYANNLNNEKIDTINSFIPIEETILNVLLSKESKTNTEYWLVETNSAIYILNNERYKKIGYETPLTFEVILAGLMSQLTNFNNIAMEIEAPIEKVEEFKKILVDKNYREQVYLEKSAYLCNKVPLKQLINSIGVGVTITTDNKIVLHGKENKVVEFDEIDRIDVLSDNCVILTRGKMVKSMVSAKLNCYRMDLKITTTNNNVYILEVLPPNTFGTLYKREDSDYIDAFEFCKAIISLILQDQVI